MLIDMSVYQVKWVTEPKPWDLVEGLLDCPEQLLNEPEDSKWVGDIPRFKYQNRTLQIPSTVSMRQTDLGLLSNSWLL